MYQIMLGYINSSGERITDDIFTEATNFVGDYAAVKVPYDYPEGYYGYIDKSGEFAIEPMYTSAEPFMKGKAFVSVDDGANPAKYLIDENGNELTEPICSGTVRYSSIVNSESGLCPARSADDTGYVYINEEGEVVLPRTGSPYGIANDFKDGLACVQDAESGLCGYIDPEGNWVIEPQYVSVSDFDGEVAVVGTGLDESKMQMAGQAIDKSGNCLWEFGENMYWAGCSAGGRIPVRTIGPDDLPEGKTGFYDQEGNMIIDCIFDQTKGFASDGSYAKVSYEGLWGIIDKDGNWLIQPEFQSFYY